MGNQPANFSNSAIRDNVNRGSVGEFLTEKIKPDSSLSFVSAYFTIYAFEALKENLKSTKHLNFLFGEPSFIKALDPSKMETKIFEIEQGVIKLNNFLEQKKIAKECSDWIKEKVDIRSLVKPDFLHGKMYHITQENGVAEAILGSSNFTVRGLGFGSKPNIELNMEIHDNRDRDDLLNWFNETWNTDIVKDVKEDVLRYLEQLYQNNSPEFIYYKTLFHIFEDFLNEAEDSSILTEKNQLVETKIWKTLFEFQKDGVKGAINKILENNGCVIADSVGLGKTYEALAIIKYFELLNDRVLVLCPKKIVDNWTIYPAYNNHELNPFMEDRLNFTVLCHTDLSRKTGASGNIDLANFNWGNFDLVVIDESHNFRNSIKGKRDEDGNIVSKSRYERLMDDIIKSGIKTKVLMLSATPVNTNLKDLRNQIYFITENKDDAFKESMSIRSLKDTIAIAQREFTAWTDLTGKPARDVKYLLEKLPSAFFKLLDELTIARSRKHIQSYYSEELDNIGNFPIREKPTSIFPDIDTKDRFISYDKLNDEISKYKLSLFNPANYVKDEFRAEYDPQTVLNFSQYNRESFLIGMMKVNFLKRLESSIESFEITMKRTVDKIELLEDKVKKYLKHRDKNETLDENQIRIDDIDDEEYQQALQIGKNFPYKLDHLRLNDWLKDLKLDKGQLNTLFLQAKDITPERDAKLQELKRLIRQKVQNPTFTKDQKQNKKVLVFTAFADTAEYLYASLKEWAIGELKVHIAMVSGGSGENKSTYLPKGFLGQTEYNRILTNFSPVAKNRSKMKAMPQEGEIDILIATDCISEGQNLQDCDYLINYDIHWNPVKVIQRFGRIDRIGTINNRVTMVNFWPTEDLNKYINLKHRVEARMALVDIAATNDDNILDTKKLESLVKEDMKYRDKQLLKLKEEILDLEDFNESVSLSEFTLDDFRIDLVKYLEKNRDLLENAPLGINTVVSSPSSEYATIVDYSKLDKRSKEIIAPGIIFCLKQKGDSSGNEVVNPLQPYFLIYVRDDGEVRFTFTQVKQILEMYRILCLGKSDPFDTLCNLFDDDTANGQKMEHYSKLLDRSVKAIVKTFRKRSIDTVFGGRGTVLPEEHKQVLESSDFELITWLILK
ncbi:helicase-related protein [candidate division KSB1 bacterium]